VREDYSADGDVWRSFPHEHARSRAYRWGEDGLLGIADHQCRLAFSLALWNEGEPGQWHFRNGLPADGPPLSSEIGRVGRPVSVRRGV
jgi:hypothetical protein